MVAIFKMSGALRNLLCVLATILKIAAKNGHHNGCKGRHFEIACHYHIPWVENLQEN
jgi:hypothetical protein